MAGRKKETQEQAARKASTRKVRETREPREDLQDESQARNEKVDSKQFGESPAPAAGSPNDPAADKRDESQERNEAVSEAQEADEEDLGLRSQKDGGYRQERKKLPVVRPGEVYEDVRPPEDDHRRYVKVLLGPDDDGKVLVQNEETYRTSKIDQDRFTPENGWARYAS
jgi:hypothetical protein